MNHPRHPYTKNLLASAPSADSHPKSLIHTHPIRFIASTDLIGCPYVGNCPYAMNICAKSTPAYTEDENGHGTACWLQHCVQV
jgi:oligopeptide/dipeptide ABC transporter ATP-binding protein